MRICLTAMEIFAWGKIGGFGRATRIIGSELVKQGVEVVAVVPRRKNQRAVELLDGMQVLSFPVSNPLAAIPLFRQANADIYHSEEPTMNTFLAQIAMPKRKHMITFRDTHETQDWLIELRMPSVSRAQVATNWLYQDNPMVSLAVRRAHARYAAAGLIIEKAQRKYHLREAPEFLPTPVRVPGEHKKSALPTVCYISRWDKRKRPEIFFDLARQFPQVRFIAVGKSRDPNYDKYLRQIYGGLPNLELAGFIDQFASDDLSKLLSRSWILVNTAAREGLPNAFIEATAHGCAILSAVDPDGFASRFGYHVQNDDFAYGLGCLLENDTWQALGEAAFEYTRHTYALEPAIQRHIDIYTDLCKKI